MLFPVEIPAPRDQQLSLPPLLEEAPLGLILPALTPIGPPGSPLSQRSAHLQQQRQ